MGIFEATDDRSELLLRETSSGALIYNKPETVIIENEQEEECPGIYTGQWVSMNILTESSLNLISQGTQEMRHGRGTHFFSDGTLYEGYWLQDRIHGLGRKIYRDASVYTGNW